MEYYKKKYTKFIQSLKSRGYVYLGEGATRVVYRRGAFVIKIPLSQYGIVDNDLEDFGYDQFLDGEGSKDFEPAPCRILSNHCLLMPFVKQICVGDIFPDWCKNIEGLQCGFYKNRVVAFDFAGDMPERYHQDFMF